MAKLTVPFLRATTAGLGSTVESAQHLHGQHLDISKVMVNGLLRCSLCLDSIMTFESPRARGQLYRSHDLSLVDPKHGAGV